MRIPFHVLAPAVRPLERELLAAIWDVLRSGQYLRGHQTAQFEEEWVKCCGQSYAVACAKGTDALTLAATDLGLQQASVPANTVWYTAEGLRRAGTAVRSVDVLATGGIAEVDGDSVTVPLYGMSPTLRELSCRLFAAAQAHGWQPPPHAGATWSFYPTKNLGSLGDAGAVTTNDKPLADDIRRLAGRDDQYHADRQIVSHISELQAAILRIRLRSLDPALCERRQIGACYLEHLPSTMPPVTTHGNFHLFVIQTPCRERLMQHLWLAGIGSKVHDATPLHRFRQLGPPRPALAAGRGLVCHRLESSLLSRSHA